MRFHGQREDAIGQAGITPSNGIEQRSIATNLPLARCGGMTGVQSEAATKAQTKLARSAGKLEDSAQQQTDSADRRTELAADRTVLAAERTYAAWVRTGLTALAAGVGARALLEAVVPLWLAMATGSVLILFSAFCFVAAVWRQMMRVSPPRPPDAPRLPSWLLIFINGFLSLVSFAALIGIWTA